MAISKAQAAKRCAQKQGRRSTAVHACAPASAATAGSKASRSSRLPELCGYDLHELGIVKVRVCGGARGARSGRLKTGASSILATSWAKGGTPFFDAPAIEDDDDDPVDLGVTAGTPAPGPPSSAGPVEATGVLDLDERWMIIGATQAEEGEEVGCPAPAPIASWGSAVVATAKRVLRRFVA